MTPNIFIRFLAKALIIAVPWTVLRALEQHSLAETFEDEKVEPPLLHKKSLGGKAA